MKITILVFKASEKQKRTSHNCLIYNNEWWYRCKGCNRNV